MPKATTDDLWSTKKEKYGQYGREYKKVREDLKKGKQQWAEEYQEANKLLTKRPLHSFRDHPSDDDLAKKKLLKSDRIDLEASLMKKAYPFHGDVIDKKIQKLKKLKERKTELKPKVDKAYARMEEHAARLERVALGEEDAPVPKPKRQAPKAPQAAPTSTTAPPPVVEDDE